MLSRVGLVLACGIGLAGFRAAKGAGQATIGLTAGGVSPVIIGAEVPIQANVSNTAPVGSNALNYTLTFTDPDHTPSTVSDTRAADGGAGSDEWTYSYDTSASGFGVNNVVVQASDGDSTNDSVTVSVPITVLNHALPAMWINGKLVTAGPPAEPAAAEPTVDPLAFGATGGGESFAASAPGLINDPPLTIPTAEMDLDSLTLTGDPQISITLHPYTDEAADDDVTAGVPWNIDVDGSVPGTYTAWVDAAFSDQDLPGADAPGSIHWLWRIDATVLPDGGGVSGTLTEFPSPEPGSLLLLGMGTLRVMMRGGRHRRARWRRN